MRNSIFVCGLILMNAVLALGQTSVGTSIDAGAVSGHVYSNPFLGITWEFPEDWAVQNNAASFLGDENHVLLRSLPSGPQSAELVEVSCATNSSADHLKSLLKSNGWKSTETQWYNELGGGIPAVRNNFRSNDDLARYLTILTGARRGFYLNFVFIAASTERLDELVKKITSLKVQPDWGAPEEPLAPVVPGTPPRRIRISADVAHGFVKSMVQPEYPSKAKAAHIQGSVVMIAHISREGALKNLYVISGDPLLIPAALDAVSQWRYRPYILNGEPVEVETQITVIFTLGG